jgi:hypothetical protein
MYFTPSECICITLQMYLRDLSTWRILQVGPLLKDEKVTDSNAMQDAQRAMAPGVALLGITKVLSSNLLVSR